MSWLKAHVVKERVRGMREEVKILLLNLDNSPFEVPTAQALELPAGGVEGQVLSKASEDNYDVEWATPESGTPEAGAWTVITDAQMQHGWRSLSADYAVRYRKRPDNVVELRGYAKAGSEDIMFNLPEGFRPNMESYYDGLVFEIVGYDSGASGIAKFPRGIMTVNGNGDVYCALVPANAYYMHICNVTFSTD